MVKKNVADNTIYVSNGYGNASSNSQAVNVVDEGGSYTATVKFIRLTYADLTDRMLELLRDDPSVVVLLSTHHRNGVGSQRAAMHRLLRAGCDVPVVLHREFRETDVESLQLKAAADFGTLLLDGFGDGLMLRDEGVETVVTDRCMFRRM